MNLPPQHVPIVDEPDESGRSLLLSKFWYQPLKNLLGHVNRATVATDPTALGGFTIGTVTARWVTMKATGSPKGATNAGDVLEVTVPVTPPATIGDIVGAHLYIENPDQSTGTTLLLDGTTSLGTAKPMGSWAPQDLGQQAYVAGQAFVVFIHDAVPGQQIRLYAQAYTDVLDVPPTQAGHTGATPSAVVTVPDFAPLKVGSGVDYEPLIKLTSVTTLTDDWSTGTRRTPVVVAVDTSSLPNPAPANWACEVVIVWDNDPAPDPNAGKNIATGTFGVDEINLAAGILPAGQDGIAAAHTLALDTPTSLIGLTVYVRSLKRLVQTTARSGTPVTRERLLRNTIVPGVTPSAHIVLGATDGTVDIGAALANSISSEFVIVTVAGQKQIQMLNLNMSKATHLSSQFVFDPVLGVQKIAQLDAGVIISGFLQVGGGGNKVSQFKIFDTSSPAQLIGFIGDDSLSSGAVGAWFKRVYIGGTSPATAKIVADALGNVAINGSLIVGPVAQATSATTAAIFNGSIQATQVIAGQFTGLALSLTKNGITTTIDNNLVVLGYTTGLRIVNAGNNGTLFAGASSSGAAFGITDAGGSRVSLNYSFGGNASLVLTGDGAYAAQLGSGASGAYLNLAGTSGTFYIDTRLKQFNVPSGFSLFVSGAVGQSATISYTKSGGGTGTMTFTNGWLTSFT